MMRTVEAEMKVASYQAEGKYRELWEATQRAVESLEYSPTEIIVFGSQSGKTG